MLEIHRTTRGPSDSAGVALVALLALMLPQLGPGHAKPLAPDAPSALLDYDTMLKLQKLLLEPVGGGVNSDEELKDRATLLDSELLINHELVRKSAPNRTPSLRLRFGRRSDPGVAARHRFERLVAAGALDAQTRRLLCGQPDQEASDNRPPPLSAARTQ